VAQLITPSPSGDTPKVIEDKTRALPANQGLNEYDMWIKINTEITSAIAAGKLNPAETYVSLNKHRNK